MNELKVLSADGIHFTFTDNIDGTTFERMGWVEAEYKDDGLHVYCLPWVIKARTIKYPVMPDLSLAPYYDRYYDRYLSPNSPIIIQPSQGHMIFYDNKTHPAISRASGASWSISTTLKIQ